MSRYTVDQVQFICPGAVCFLYYVVRVNGFDLVSCTVCENCAKFMHFIVRVSGRVVITVVQNKSHSHPRLLFHLKLTCHL